MDDGLTFNPETVEACRIKEDADYPSLLDLPAPTLRTYPPETVVAEKAEAMVHLGNRDTTVIEFDDLVAELLKSENPEKQWTAFLRKSAVSGPATFTFRQAIQMPDKMVRVSPAPNPFAPDKVLTMCPLI